jgi:hypothetical protein
MNGADFLKSIGGVPDDEQPAADATLSQTPVSSDDEREGARFLRSIGGVADQPGEGPDAFNPEAERESDYGATLQRIGKNVLAPHLLEKKDFEGDRTVGEMVAETAGSVAGDIAVGAALGSVVPGVGTLTGAVVAPVAMALYRGFGYEYARSKAQGESFDPIRGVLNFAAEANPVMMGGGRILKFISQAGLEGAREFSYSKDAVGSGVVGAVSGAVAAAFHVKGPGWLGVTADLASGPKGGIDVKDAAGLTKLVQSNAEFGQRLDNGVAAAKQIDGFFDLARTRELAEEFAQREGDIGVEMGAGGLPAVNMFEDRINQFKRWFVKQPGMRAGDDLDVTFDHYAKSLGEERIKDDFAIWAHREVAAEVTKRYNNDVAKGISPKLKDPLESKFAERFRDIKFVMRRIDKKIGTNFEGMVDAFTEAKNHQSMIVAPLFDEANDLVKAGRSAGLSNEDVGRHLAETTKEGLAKLPKLDEAQTKVVEGWRQFFKNVRTKAQEKGMSIDELQSETGNYLPRRSLTGADLNRSFRKERARLVQAYGDDFLEKKSKDVLQFKEAVAHVLKDKKSKITAGDVQYNQQIDEAMEKMLDPRNGKSLEGFEAFASFQRSAQEIPSFVQDFDIGRLAVNYANNVFKAATYHDAFMQMSANMEILKKLGLKRSHDYLKRYIDDVSGKPSETIAGVQYKINKHKVNAQNAIDDLVDVDGMSAKVKRGFYGIKKDLPDYMGYAMQSLYPNLLGWNFKAAIRNYAQPFLVTAPELGWGYGSRLVAKATAGAWKDRATGTNFAHFLRDRHLAPGKFFGEGLDVSSDSLRATKYMGRAIEGIDKLNDMSMFLYSASDNVNRYITYKVGQQLAKDVVAGNESALKYVTRVMSEGNKRGVRDLISAGKTDELGDLLARQLITKTQFNYGKESLNEFGRENGRLFSMFTKWPATVMSDTAELLETHGAVKGSTKVAQRYFAPMAALMMAGEYLVDTDASPTLQWLVGTDLSDAAPAQSMKVGAPPVIGTALAFSKTFMDMFDKELDSDQRLDKVGALLGKTALTYAPGMAPFNEYARWSRAHGE